MLTTSLNGYQFYNPIEAYKPFIFWEVFWYEIVWKFCEHTASPKGLLNFDFALEFFANLRARAGSTYEPAALGLHILMGDTRAVKLKNMIQNIDRNLVAPVEIVAETATVSGESTQS